MQGKNAAAPARDILAALKYVIGAEEIVEGPRGHVLQLRGPDSS